MPRTHRPYPPEFRAEAVRLAQGSDKSIPAVLLGSAVMGVSRWVRSELPCGWPPLSAGCIGQGGWA